jgi:hypothetical protein
MPTIEGTFEITLEFSPPHDESHGVSLARAAGEKTFSGGLTASSRVEMLSARRTEPSSAAYVALEKVSGKVQGREGSFVLLHQGLMNPSGQSLQVMVMPGSGTASLEGISGTMDIRIEEGRHFYVFQYELQCG